jgi:hypothetical protein
MSELMGSNDGDPAIHGEHILVSGAEQIRYLDVHQLYAGSDYGAHHAKQELRFSKVYPYERDAMLEDLGDDIHPVRHMTHTEQNICRPFMDMQNNAADTLQKFTNEQIAAMRLGVLLHDIGECEHPSLVEDVGHIVGDVPYLQRTQSDSDLEVPIRMFFYDQLFKELPEGLVEKAEAVISETDSEFINKAFNTIERIGYFQTAMKAGRTALTLFEQSPEDNSQRFIQLSRLARRVSTNHLDTLEERTEDFPYTGAVLAKHDWLFDRVHTELAHIPLDIP